MLQSTELLKELFIYLANEDYKVYFDKDSKSIEVNLTAIITIKENQILLSYDIETEPTFAGMLSIEIVEFIQEHKEYEFGFCDPHTLIHDANGNFLDILFGDEAIYYLMSKDEVEISTIISENKKENEKDKANRLFDQLALKGIKSFSKDERDFLSKVDFKK